jgi:hypothetical protein
MPALGTGAQANRPVGRASYDARVPDSQTTSDGPPPPDETSAKAILERLGHEPAILTEFEAAYGAVKPADGD